MHHKFTGQVVINSQLKHTSWVKMLALSMYCKRDMMLGVWCTNRHACSTHVRELWRRNLWFMLGSWIGTFHMIWPQTEKIWLSIFLLVQNIYVLWTSLPPIIFRSNKFPSQNQAISYWWTATPTTTTMAIINNEINITFQPLEEMQSWNISFGSFAGSNANRWSNMPSKDTDGKISQRADLGQVSDQLWWMAAYSSRFILSGRFGRAAIQPLMMHLMGKKGLMRNPL